jgi:2-polyprenyl-6-methoxyphenol hydroxylase-like FAD-dependent oxidoreductase
MTDDVVIIGGGPNGLLLACELALAGVRPTVLEQHAERPPILKANGLVGRVVRAMDTAGCTSGSAVAPDRRRHPVPVRQVLAERATELGVTIHKGSTRSPPDT